MKKKYVFITIIIVLLFITTIYSFLGSNQKKDFLDRITIERISEMTPKSNESMAVNRKHISNSVSKCYDYKSNDLHCYNNTTHIPNNFNSKLRDYNLRLSKYSREYNLGTLKRIQLKNNYAVIKERISQSILNKKWSQLIDDLPILLDTRAGPEALKAAMVQALMSDAPIKVFKTLFSMGATLPVDSIEILAITGNLNLTRKLLTYGLDLYYVDPVGRNAIEYLIYFQSGNFISKHMGAMIKFLVNNGVSLDSRVGNLDALNFAFIGFSKNNVKSAILFSRILLDLGASLNGSHHQQILQLRKNKPNIYNDILKFIPEIESN